jgi:hypothetical protein
MGMGVFESPMTVNVRSRLVVATLIASLGLMAGVPVETQLSPVRRYSDGGLEIDLPGDWQLAFEDADGGLTFRSAAARGEIVFIVWLPLRQRGYLGSFESFVKEKLPNVQGRRDVKRLQVSGLDALSLSERQVDLYRGQRVTVETRETWIGVPDGTAGGTVFRFFTTVEVSGPRREAVLMAYEHMLASMRIDPVALHQ